MKRIAYIFSTCFHSAVGLAVLLWFFAPYNTVGVEHYLPKRNLFNGTCVILLLTALKMLRDKIGVPLLSDSLSLNKAAYRILRKIGFWLYLIPVVRFTCPLITHRLSWSAKLKPRETMFYLVAMFIGTVMLQFLKLFLKTILPSADEVLSKDTRKPVVYFRSFEKELKKSRIRGVTLSRFFNIDVEGFYMFSRVRKPGDPLAHSPFFKRRAEFGTSRSVVDEQMIFAPAFEEIGPYIALGRPTENYRNMDLGAAKKYVSNEHWRDAVIFWLNNCAAVVVEAADSASLGWEIEQITRCMSPTTVLILCPHTEKEYQAFVDAFERFFPRGLPAARPKSRLLTFDKIWLPKELKNIDKIAAESLEPFFEQVRLENAV